MQPSVTNLYYFARRVSNFPWNNFSHPPPRSIGKTRLSREEEIERITREDSTSVRFFFSLSLKREYRISSFVEEAKELYYIFIQMNFLKFFAIRERKDSIERGRDSMLFRGWKIKGGEEEDR